MNHSLIKRGALVLALALVLSAAALAQTGPIEGTVKVKTPEGPKPVAGATVNIYRTDIKGSFEVKTDKQGHYVRLGMPLQGTFLVVASGPGMQPSWVNNVRLARQSVVDITAEPGEGGTLTYEQVMAAIGKGGGSAPADAQPTVSAADRAKALKEKEEYDKAVKDSQAMQANFDTARTRYNTGIDLMKQNNFAAALPEFEAAKSVEIGKHVEFLRLAYKANANYAEANYQIGVDKFNKKDKPGAKPNFEQAATSAAKALELAATDTAPEAANDQKIYYEIYAKNMALLVEHYGQADKIEQAAKMYDKAAALDPATKVKWDVKKGDLYRFAGISDKAAESYKGVITSATDAAAKPQLLNALYGLGLTLIASPEKPVIQEGANALGDFAAKADASDPRLPAVKEALEAVKNAYKIEAEKPAKRGGKKP